MFMRAVRVTSVVGLSWAIALFTGCGRQNNAAAAAPAGAQALPVKTVKAEAQSVGQYTEYVSTLKSRNSSVLQPEVEGQITKIMVASGDRVEPGQPILQIDPSKQQATVHSQEATLNSRRANLELARKDLDRTRQLAAAGVVSKQALDQAQSQFDAAQADERRAVRDAQAAEFEVVQGRAYKRRAARPVADQQRHGLRQAALLDPLRLPSPFAQPVQDVSPQVVGNQVEGLLAHLVPLVIQTRPRESQ